MNLSQELLDHHRHVEHNDVIKYKQQYTSIKHILDGSMERRRILGEREKIH